MPGLIIHKLADKSIEVLPRPLLGIRLEPAPEAARVPDNVILQGASEGWITLEGAKPVMRPAGPTPDDWVSSHTGQPHVFMQADAVIFHTVDGDIRYKVTHNPDKYADHDEATWEIRKFKGGDDVKVTREMYEAGATRVDHFFDLVKES